MRDHEDEIRARIGRRLRRRFALGFHWLLTFPALYIINVIYSAQIDANIRGTPYLFAGFGLLLILAIIVHSVRVVYHEILDRAVQQELDRMYPKRKHQHDQENADPFDVYVGNDGEYFVSDAPDDYDYMRPYLQDTGEFVPDDMDELNRRSRGNGRRK